MNTNQDKENKALESAAKLTDEELNNVAGGMRDEDGHLYITSFISNKYICDKYLNRYNKDKAHCCSSCEHYSKGVINFCGSIDKNFRRVGT
jgi:hypothetical protein